MCLCLYVKKAGRHGACILNIFRGYMQLPKSYLASKSSRKAHISQDLIHNSC